MKLAFAVVAGAVALLALAVLLVTTLVPSSGQVMVFTVLGPLIVMATALSAVVLRKRQERSDRSGAVEGIERELVIGAQSKVMVDTIVVALALGCLLLFVHGIPSALGLLVIVVFILGDFYLRLALLRHAVSKS